MQVFRGITSASLFASLPILIRAVGAAELSSIHANVASAIAPSLAVTNESGQPIRLLSLEAYGAEFRYLREWCRQIDLTGPPITTDGWTHNIAEAEWPFMAFSYFGYACANLAKVDAQLRPEALAQAQWLIDALQTPRMSGFVAPHFGEPFGNDTIAVSVFVHGHFLSLCLRYREVSRDTRYDAIIHRVAAALTNAFAASPSGVLRSYRDMWWISDNLPAFSALARYERQFQRDIAVIREKFLKTTKTHFLDPATGLLATYVDANTMKVLQGPRGISTMYGLHFLRDLSDELATDQYRRAREHFIRSALGFAAVREFPQGIPGPWDIDSGPLVFGFGPSASGFAIAAAAVMDDELTAAALLKASVLAGLPEFQGEQIRYGMMPPVGQAVILFGKTELLRRQKREAAAQ